MKNLNIKNAILLTLLSLGCALSASAQRQPSTAIKPYIVKTDQSVDDINKSLQGANKVEELIGGAGMQMRVAIQHDEKKDSAQAELHDNSDDIYYVIEGSAELTLGGKLDNPKEASPGEWKSDKIIDGKTFTIKKGDLIIVPRGTPHQRINTKGKTFSLILVKVFAEPMTK